MSVTRAVLSVEPVASYLPSGENATETTESLCLIVSFISPVIRSVILADASPEPVAIYLPSFDILVDKIK